MRDASYGESLGLCSLSPFQATECSHIFASPPSMDTYELLVSPSSPIPTFRMPLKPSIVSAFLPRSLSSSPLQRLYFVLTVRPEASPAIRPGALK